MTRLSALLLPLALAVLLSLSGCGFEPMYATPPAGTGTDAKAGLQDVYVANIPDRTGQYLRNDLIDRFYQHGRPDHPAYTLHIEKLTETLTDLDITKNSTATRAQLRLNTRMTLKDNATGNLLLDRRLVAITSYNVLQSQFTTRVSEENARTNAIDDLARQIESQLALYFRRTP